MDVGLGESGNRSEEMVREKYEKEGWYTLRRGEPDFVFIKTDENDRIVDAVFVEVKTRFIPPLAPQKSNSHRLSERQKNYRSVLKWLGAKYTIEHVECVRGKRRMTSKRLKERKRS